MKMNMRKIDTVLAHPVWGIAALLALMLLTFYVTFSLGSYPVRLVEYGIEQLSCLLQHLLPDNLFRSFLTEGIVRGVGGVLSFLPNVLILFLFITIFEESNYIFRAMYVTDRLMHAVGLHGDSFLPIVMGFGCGVPAIMAAGKIRNRSQQLLTLLVIPFMSCNARLPVYILLISAFIPHHAAVVLFCLYLAGITVGAVGCLIISRLFIKQTHDDVHEIRLAPYRLPDTRTTLRKVWSEASDYLKKITNVVLLASALIWALNTFPQPAPNDTSPHESYLEKIGKTISPVFAPLGFDWKMSVSLITGVAAKETIVSTLAVLYNTGDDKQQLSNQLHDEPVFTPPAVVAFLIFILLYFPCVSAVACIYKVTRKWRFTLLTVCYTTGVAWVVAFLAYHLTAVCCQ
jgi:ferrous iron transport protein B